MHKVILAKVLKAEKLSKRQFAIRIGMDYPSVFRYFRKGYDPKVSTLAKWAKALGIKIRDLIEE